MGKAYAFLYSSGVLYLRLQDGDPFAQYPDDADVPEGESEVAFRIRAATEIKGIGNELYKKASDLSCMKLQHSLVLSATVGKHGVCADMLVAYNRSIELCFGA